MPWTGASFHHHNLGLSPAQSAHAAAIANHVLQSTGDEGESIATANKLVHRDTGGALDPTSGGIGGMSPATAGGNPMVQGLAQQYSSLSTEKLQEMNAMLGGSPQGQIIRSVLQRRLSQPNAQPQPQQPAMGMQPAQQTVARGGMVHRAIGGGNPMGMSPSEASPWWEKQEAYGSERPASGFLMGTTPGRADSIKTTAPGGAYVLSADVVAGLGEGNSLAGARAWDEILRSGPHGIDLGRSHQGRGPPRPPTDPALARGLGVAKGGGVQPSGRHTPVALSHGEIVVLPEDVTRFGGGDHARGTRILDKFSMAVRKHWIHTLKKSPPPVGAKRN